MTTESGAHGLSRREFLQALSASFATLGLAGCDFRPPREAIVPFLVQPEEVVPGTSRWYASTCAGCPASCGLLVKSRDGRPIKIEGNRAHPLSRGGVCARGQATVLDLYDSSRLRGPTMRGEKATWADADRAIQDALGGIRDRGGAIRLLTGPLVSLSLLAAIARFQAAYPTARHVVYSPLAPRAILDAHEATHGARLLPWYRFARARVVVSLGADFLGTWISPVEYTKDWAANRVLSSDERTLSWHVQIESHLSVTGANADLRLAIPPSAELSVALSLVRRLALASDPGIAARLPSSGPAVSVPVEALDRIARGLLGARGEGLVVSGSPDRNVQILANIANHLCGNYGPTVDIERPSFQGEGSVEAADELLKEMEAGTVDALLLLDANPVYDHPKGAAFREAIGRIELSVSLTGAPDETSAAMRFRCPDTHFLESWGDARPRAGLYAVLQPLIRPLFDARPALESLLAWAGEPALAHDFLRREWKEKVFPRVEPNGEFEAFWTEALQTGVVEVGSERTEAPAFQLPALELPEAPQGRPEGIEIVLYPTIALASGRQANNPWLQELPDPITKVSWGNVASFSPITARWLGLEDGRLVRLSSGEASIEIPAHVQPGLPEGVAAVALGHGRWEAGPIAANYPVERMLPIPTLPAAGANGFVLARASRVWVESLEEKIDLARSQIYDYQVEPYTGHDRNFARETTVADWRRDPAAGNPHDPPHRSLSPENVYPGHKWEMAIDLNRCTGCSACLVACQAENNVPVVGRSEVARGRDMYWIRIDRYYGGSPGAPDGSRVSFLPMLCQHCDGAPCEPVCPVLASVHSSEGINMMVYNRCVGTRFCDNNCPYKVRRFNWFDYAHADTVQNLALNPDITVRSRGVMEKCSFCFQRISDARARARDEGRGIADGEIKPACVESCPG
ncbi:MAG: 4Fe-4S dicluster domain-containing protein, partial [Planctomycetes bacterium]|nr:4Fe-4S dicluster domain-containing protein [Planctomycetota bacterium]